MRGILRHGGILLATVAVTVAVSLYFVRGEDVGQAQRTTAPSLENRLAASTSPYLRSAAEQPVFWQQWEEEAFALAKELDRPILLDIGAIWCHWCHVMDRLVYEDEEIAALINEIFVPVKVDRDLRPDIDQRYQRAVTAITGRGGWPLTAFLTSDGEVFYGRTYIPPDSMKSLLPQIRDAFQSRRGELETAAKQVTAQIQATATTSLKSGDLNAALIDSVLQSARQGFDETYGGFGKGNTKFPDYTTMDLLFRIHDRSGDESILGMIEKTLTAMAKGGVYDQLGGKFHRYATDQRWHVPHFEIMLYDNAGLLANYVEAYRTTKNPFYREIAEAILSAYLGLYADPAGGFYANQDADVNLEDDGSYFTWTTDEVEAVLNGQSLQALQAYYGIEKQGDMHSAPQENVLHIAKEPADIAATLKIPEGKVIELIHEGKKQMLAYRETLQAPLIDKNLYVDWNGMMLSAALEAAVAFENPTYGDFAIKTIDRLIKVAYDKKRKAMFHAYYEGQANIFGLLDDQVQMANVLIDASMYSGDGRYLELAEELAQYCLKALWDERGGGFFDSPSDGTPLGLLSTQRKPLHDSPTPSANATAARVLMRLYYLTSNDEYRRRGEAALQAFAGSARQFGIGAAAYFDAVDLFLHPPAHAVIIGDPHDQRTEYFRRKALEVYRPERLVQVFSPKTNTEELPLPVRGMLGAVDDTLPVAFVCAGTACAPPTTRVEQMAELLRTFGRQMQAPASN